MMPVNGRKLLAIIKEKYQEMDELKSLSALVVIFAMGAAFSPEFFTTQNLGLLTGQMAVVAMASIGEGLVIIMGSIDLSVGSVMGLSNVLGAIIISRYNFSAPMAMLAVATVGGFVGLLNGIAVTKGKIPSFIVTLGTLTGIRGAAYLLSGGLNIPIYEKEFLALNELVVGIPKIFWIYAGFLIALSLIFKFTKLGLYIRAIGGNEIAVRNLGVDNEGVKTLAFTLSGICSAIAGFMLGVRLGAGYPHSGLGYELDVIAAVVVGGTSLVGGTGSLAGTLIGAVIMASILNLMVLMGISAFTQYVVRGVVLMLAALAMRRMVVSIK